MQRNPVSSSNVASVGYDPQTRTLEIEFNGSGAVYQYRNVPSEVYDGLMRAPRAGVYFAENIRGVYDYGRV